MEPRFERELALIKDEEVRSIVSRGVKLIPDYFYVVPASSSGKYHPEFALGEGGLYRHVRATIKIAVELLVIVQFPPLEQDLIIGSLILHDGWKQGRDGSGGKTLHEHPIIATEVLGEALFDGATPHQRTLLSLIFENIASHMGQWQTSKYSEAVLPLPDSSMRQFVHLCDYVASRKSIEIKLD